jgi:hypothetical protein
MPIPFSDVEDRDTLGSAAFLKLNLNLEPELEVERSSDDACCLGALFVISARGEPLEFAYNRVRVPQPYLWRQTDLRSYVERRLTTSLLSVCSQQPRLVVCLANEVSTGLFSQGLQLEVPVARVSELPPSRRRVDPETGEVFEDEDVQPQVAWQPAPPDAGSAACVLWEHLTAHGLVFEPFGRAALGLLEVYGPTPCVSKR